MKRLFLYLSKTDPEIIEQLARTQPVAGKDARFAQMSLGLMVFITGVLAFASGSYALYTTFQDWRVALSVGLIYACLIMAFDREIVSATNKSTVFIRFPLALFIGVAVALPLEMRLLQGRLDKQLQQEEQSENKAVQTRRDEKVDSFRQKTAKLQSEVEKYREAVDRWGDAIEAEDTGRPAPGRSGLAGRGVKYNAAKQRQAESQKLLEKAEADLQKHLAEEAKIFNEADRDYQQRFINQRYDFLSRFEALETLKANSPAAWKVSWVLRLLFIFIELFPALAKLFTPSNVYSGLIDSRRNVAIQTLFVAANAHMQAIRNNPPAYPPPPFNVIGARSQTQTVNPTGVGIP